MGRMVFWAIIIIAVLVIGRRLYTYFYNQSQPERSIAVLVLDKRYQEFMGQTRRDQTELPPPRVNYYVTFRPLEGDDEREFEVGKPLYEQIQLEQTGTLVFRGHRFIAFVPEDDD